MSIVLYRKLKLMNISCNYRAFCWQPCHSKKFTIPQKQHSYHLHIGTEAELERFLENLGEMRELGDEELMMECSQTESQDVITSDLLPEAERIPNSASPSKSKENVSQNEETPPVHKYHFVPGRMM